MKKILIYIASCVFLFASCEEWGPVFTGEYDNPDEYEIQTLTPTHTIAELAAKYTTGTPLDVTENIIIAGKVSTTDQPGNFYKSFYIQDETAGIEIKVGKTALYNDYKPGQTVYVKCTGLTVGMYGYKSSYGSGMISIGYKSTVSKYETSYIESPLLIDMHIIRGERGEELEPVVVEEKDLPTKNNTQANNTYIGRLITLKGLTYANEAFVLLYLDSKRDTDSADNRIFLSDGTYGITTWAMSKDKMKSYLLSGIWDDAVVGSGSTTYDAVGTYKGENGNYDGIQKSASSVSQYFTMGSREIQIRTSGYSKFSDYEIPEDVLDGSRSIDVTGVLTLYQGSIQFTVNSAADFVYSDDGTPLYK